MLGLWTLVDSGPMMKPTARPLLRVIVEFPKVGD